MIQIFNTINKLSAMIIFVVFIFTTNLSWAWGIFFADYYIQDLKMTAVNTETETVIFESPDGETATLAEGDVIGVGAFTIRSIHKKSVELESPPDDRGKVEKFRVFVNQIKTLEDCTFIEPKNLKPAFKKNK